MLIITLFKILCETIQSLNADNIQYSIKETLSGFINLEELPEEVFKHISDFWNAKFFSNEGVSHDKPYPGAREFVLKLIETGATIVYLTGRHEKREGFEEKGMVSQTRENLLKHEFPYKEGDPQTDLIFKENYEDLDHVFKDQVATRIKGIGEVAAILENEPSNVTPMRKRYPNALMTFVYTQNNDKAVAPVKGDDLILFEWDGVEHRRDGY